MTMKKTGGPGGGRKMNMKTAGAPKSRGAVRRAVCPDLHPTSARPASEGEEDVVLLWSLRSPTPSPARK